ncbi:phosphate butyryltransferase [Bacillus sp. REN16]|uniref:phosphate butyryltransferase n=1 Tax=Bacillus sp. REN16 TaxID=2887296 RepID=UPI001E63784D|nr:phosphate butyryltransferase [Bacillus sp. REN16]MCC3358716.1 phosphate butyryltransferase [Bacillus sp. REN16]
MKLMNLINNAKAQTQVTVAVAAAEDEEVLEAVVEAVSHGLARFLLFGNREKIDQILSGIRGFSAGREALNVVHSPSQEESAKDAVKAVHSGEANVLMKGNIPTSTILSAVLHKEYGLRTGKVLSHVAVFEVPDYDRFVIVTDAAMNIAPGLQEKVQILNNAVKVANAIGINMPKVAPIAAVEVVNPAMQATLDAAVLTQMNHRGQIQNCIVDGPLALDNAISTHAAEHKGITSAVAGQADILLVPAIEVGNALYKSLVYFAKAEAGAIIAGASAPIVLTSRADTAKSKLYSLALAVCTANK